MWECDLSHETDLKFSSARLDIYLCDDGTSFPPPEFELEATFDPLMLTPSFVAPSSPSAIMDNTMLTMSFFDPPFPLAQTTELEVGETSGSSANVDKHDTFYGLGDVSNKVHDLDATFVRRLYMDAEFIVPTSPDLVDHTSPDHLDTFYAFPSCSLLPLPECCNMPLVEYHDML